MYKYEESSVRSILKSFSWRVLATATTVLIAYIITGEIDMAKKIGCIEFVSKMLIYFLHERLWNEISFGRVKIK